MWLFPKNLTIRVNEKDNDISVNENFLHDMGMALMGGNVPCNPGGLHN